jgi:hypothetical protein
MVVEGYIAAVSVVQHMWVALACFPAPRQHTEEIEWWWVGTSVSFGQTLITDELT